MNSIQNHKHFLQFLVNSSNKKQNTNILKFIDNEQLKILQQIIKNILDGNVPLTSKEFHDLSHHQIFLRKLRSGKISKKILIQKYLVICKLVKIFLKHDAKISSSTFGIMGKNKRSKNTSERSDCESSSSESSEFQSSEEEEFTNESEEEKENSTEEEGGGGGGKHYID